MTKKLVILYTSAYNAEKTLTRAVESILKQTYTDWIYYILDNGSTDNTSKIIEKFKAGDSRIIALKNIENEKIRLLHYLPIILSKHHGNGYFCTLDADDEYAPDFLEKILAFVNKNNLDVAACGTDWINQKTGELIKHKVLKDDIILEGQKFANRFPTYRNFMATVWGVIYSFDILKQYDFKWYLNAMNFGDTAFCMEAFRRAKRAGVLAKSLHKYYISPKTESYKYNPDWFYACKNLYNISKEYLLDYGEITRQNDDYLSVLFFTLIKYILPRIQNADVDLPQKLKSLHEIFADDLTLSVLKQWKKVGIYSDKSDFLLQIKDWIYAQDGWEQSRPVADKIISTINSSLKG